MQISHYVAKQWEARAHQNNQKSLRVLMVIYNAERSTTNGLHIGRVVIRHGLNIPLDKFLVKKLLCFKWALILEMQILHAKSAEEGEGAQSRTGIVSRGAEGAAKGSCLRGIAALQAAAFCL